MKRLPRLMWAAALLPAAVMGHAFRPVVVVGHSMEPSLHHRQLVWVDGYCYQSHLPQPGEMVVFRRHGGTYIKRVYRGPGGRVYFLAHPDEELSLVRGWRWDSMSTGDPYPRSAGVLRYLEVPPDSTFVVGDNAGISEDSRSFGVIPLRDLVGRVRCNADLAPLRSCEISLPHGSNGTMAVTLKAAAMKVQRALD